MFLTHWICVLCHLVKGIGILPWICFQTTSLAFQFTQFLGILCQRWRADTSEIYSPFIPTFSRAAGFVPWVAHWKGEIVCLHWTTLGNGARCSGGGCLRGKLRSFGWSWKAVLEQEGARCDGSTCCSLFSGFSREMARNQTLMKG